MLFVAGQSLCGAPNRHGFAVALDVQVIADKLLEAAAREKAAYTSPYDDPTYAVQLAKVEAKSAREEARAAAAAAKAARCAWRCCVAAGHCAAHAPP